MHHASVMQKARQNARRAVLRGYWLAFSCLESGGRSGLSARGRHRCGDRRGSGPTAWPTRPARPQPSRELRSSRPASVTTATRVALVCETDISSLLPARLRPPPLWYQRYKPRSVDADVIDGDAALGQEFLDIAVGQSVAQLPADRDRDHLTRKPEASEHRRRTRRRHRTSLRQPLINQRSAVQRQPPCQKGIAGRIRLLLVVTAPLLGHLSHLTDRLRRRSKQRWPDRGAASPGSGGGTARCSRPGCPARR
jgi:hypothetical protein